MAVTVDIPQPKIETFAEQEQSLFSTVLAAPEQEEGSLEDPQAASTLLHAEIDVQALLQALTIRRETEDFWANGSLVVTAPQLGSAQDQAALAARAALLVKARGTCACS